jgi:hypothetical protein
VRWKGKNLKDYTFTKENLDKMRDKDLWHVDYPNPVKKNLF